MFTMIGVVLKFQDTFFRTWQSKRWVMYVLLAGDDMSLSYFTAKKPKVWENEDYSFVIASSGESFPDIPILT